MADKFDHLVKLLLIGDSGVGKSCMLLRFCDDEFTPSFITTVGIDFKIRKIVVDGVIFKLQIWDTAGQERFRTITNAYYRGAMGIVVTYDVTNRRSFESIPGWFDTIREQSPDQNVCKILVGTKIDLPEESRVITREQGKAFALEHKIPFIEVSAKENKNVDAAFVTLVNLVKKRLIEGDNERVNVITLEENSVQQPRKDKDTKCCK